MVDRHEYSLANLLSLYFNCHINSLTLTLYMYQITGIWPWGVLLNLHRDTVQLCVSRYDMLLEMTCQHWKTSQFAKRCKEVLKVLLYASVKTPWAPQRALLDLSRHPRLMWTRGGVIALPRLTKFWHRRINIAGCFDTFKQLRIQKSNFISLPAGHNKPSWAGRVKRSLI